MIIDPSLFIIHHKTRVLFLARMINGAAIALVYLGFLDELVTNRSIG